MAEEPHVQAVSFLLFCVVHVDCGKNASRVEGLEVVLVR